MIEVSEAFKTAINNGTVKNNIDICIFNYYGEGENLHIYNENIVSESMILEQSICDESDFRFGGAAASSFEIELGNVPDLTGRYITVWIEQTAVMPTYPGSITHPGRSTGGDFPKSKTYPKFSERSERIAIFSGEVYSCKLSKNHITRKLIAYDRLYWRGEINCTEWYATQHKHTGDYYYTSIYDLRKAICDNYKIVEAYSNDVLPIDTMEVEKAEGKVTVGELLFALCEMSGVFCMLNGDGNIEYHTLSSNSNIPDNIRKPGTEDYGFNYKNCDYEEFEKYFTGILHRDENGNSSWFGYTENSSFYVLNDNILADSYTGYSDWYNEMKDYINLKGFMDYLTFEKYTPMTLTVPCKMWVQLGDRITFKVRTYTADNNGAVNVEDKTITSYVLSRRIKGIQALMDEISAGGENIKYTENSVFTDD